MLKNLSMSQLYNLLRLIFKVYFLIYINYENN